MQTTLDKQRRQNRERQRAWRERKKAASKYPGNVATDPTWRGHGMLLFTLEDEPMNSESGRTRANSLHNDNRDIASDHVSQQGSKRYKLISPLLPYSTNASPNLLAPMIDFPLCPDHHLITLVQFNVVRAMIFNMSILSLLHCLPSPCTASFGVPVLDRIPPDEIPPDLRPTLLQQTTPHPFWISAIPAPAMRDNLIRLAGKYDSDDLCYDLGQALYEGYDDVERRGCIVWGDSWNVSSWELTETFVKKWGFLLNGCQKLIDSTNHWREVRGEESLILEV